MNLRLLFSALLCAFLFTANSQITTVGLIGDATPGGWDVDTDMVQDAVDTSLWTLDVTLTAGEAKFRANDDWAINWGSADFPSGVGGQDGSNIPVFAGDYTVTFNSVTGDYSFAVISAVGIIGDATPGGWDTDTNMYEDTTAGNYFILLDLVEGEAKFRQDDDWAVNWGSADFPTGVGTQDGDNMIVAPAGTYFITLNTTTGEYNFELMEEGFGVIGLIGDATPGGWDTDTDLMQYAGDPDVWQTNITLTDGELKFRADHDWAVSWGGTDFPAGTAVDGGDNIPAVAGDYQVTFNTATGEYAFSAVQTFATVGLIGDATPGGWDADTSMVQDAVDMNLWTLDVTLTAGEVKFRADDDWAVNWGSTDFPTGVGTQGGDNIPVFAGDYTVTFNSATGEYNFVVSSPVGIIGEATPGGWDMDTDMYEDTTAGNYFTILELTEGEAKFRQDNDWAVNWGSADFPTGVGTQDGDNMMVTPAGKYFITLNTTTGEYDFQSIVEFDVIGLIGDATPGGWDTDTDMMQDAGNPDLWRTNITLTDGELKFRADHDWAISWGGTDFPAGISNGDDNIPATAGDYQVTFNTLTGEYEFLIIESFTTIGLIGDATPEGWDTDTDMDQDPDDEAIWTLRVILTDGEAKFRAEDDWTFNWGSGDFPMGVGAQDGANIPVVAGDYKIRFNSITGEYNFEEVIVFNTVGIIGTATPGGWDEDADLIKNEDNEKLWELGSMVLTDGEAKFRAEDDWAVNWGAEDFPIGVGTQDGPNIPITGGTYSISVNTDTGDYMFGSPVGTKEEVLNASSVNVHPNPTSDLLNIDVANINMKGEVTLVIVDMQGKQIITEKMDASTIMQLNVSELLNGNYLLQITNSQYIIGKRFSVFK